LEDVFRYLRDRTLIGTELYVLAPEYKPLAISVQVTVADARIEHATLDAVEQAIVDFLWPLGIDGGKSQGWALGGTVDPEEIETQVARVAGVRSVGTIAFFVPSGNGYSRLKAGAKFTIEDYQLPDLVGVSAQTSAPGLPPGLTSGGSDGSGSGGSSGVSVPVVPELC
jgi:predicted nucleotidyltransferase